MKLKPGQIAIVFTPVIDAEEWTGEIHTGMVFGKEKNSEAMAYAMDMAITMAATQPFLEENPECEDLYVDIKNDILQEMFPEQYEEVVSQVEADEKGYTTDDNVIRLTRWSKTEGNA